MYKQGRFFPFCISIMLVCVSNAQAEYRVLEGDSNKAHRVMVFGSGERVENTRTAINDSRQAYCALDRQGGVPAQLPPTTTAGNRELLNSAITQIVAEPGWRTRIQPALKTTLVSWANPRQQPWTRVLDKVLCDNGLRGTANWQTKLIDIYDASK